MSHFLSFRVASFITSREQYSGNSTPATESATRVDPLATIITAPPASTAAGSPSLGPITPEPYPGYFESQTGYDIKICDAQREGISQLIEPPSLPVTWCPVCLPSILVLVNVDSFFVVGPA